MGIFMRILPKKTNKRRIYINHSDRLSRLLKRKLKDEVIGSDYEGEDNLSHHNLFSGYDILDDIYRAQDLVTIDLEDIYLIQRCETYK